MKTNLTFDNGPNVSWKSDSEHEPRNESILSILGTLFFRFTSIRELALMKDFEEVVIWLL
jgi:hypothetical protein